MDNQYLIKIAKEFENSSANLEMLWTNLDNLVEAIKKINNTAGQIEGNKNHLDNIISEIQGCVEKFNYASSKINEIDLISKNIQKASGKISHDIEKAERKYENFEEEFKQVKENLLPIVINSLKTVKELNFSSSDYISEINKNIKEIHNIGKIELGSLSAYIDSLKTHCEDIVKSMEQISSAVEKNSSNLEDTVNNLKDFEARHLPNIIETMKMINQFNNNTSIIAKWDFMTEMDNLHVKMSELSNVLLNRIEEHSRIMTTNLEEQKNIIFHKLNEVEGGFNSMKDEIKNVLTTHTNIHQFLDQVRHSNEDAMSFLENLCNLWAQKHLRKGALKQKNKTLLSKISNIFKSD